MKIEENKLVMPFFSPSLERARLFEEMDKYVKYPLIVLTGDSGYGKTTFVSQYLQRRKLPAVWIRLSSSDRYAHLFLHNVLAGLQEQSDNLKRFVDNHVNEEILLETIAEILSAQANPLYIVFDDYQHVDASNEIVSIIMQLMARASSKVTFIVISRVRPSLPITKLKLEGKYKEFSTSDLAFTLEETASFFRFVHHVMLEDQEIQLIHQKTEGWVASYQLILGMIQKMNHQERLLFWSKFPYLQDIYDYLSAEVIQSLSKELRDFLFRTSLLSELNPTIINQFLGISNSNQIIQDLVKRHLFISEDDGGIYRYHRLFRHYLLHHYKETVTDAVIIKEHRKLAAIYEKQFLLIKAFAHYTIGKDFIKAANMMDKIGGRYNPVDSMLLLDGWLDEISPNESFANNTLFLIRCIPLSVLKELTVLFEDSIAMRTEERSDLWLCNLQHRLATIYLMRGHILKAKALFEKSLEGSSQFHDHAMSALNLTLLSEIHRYTGNKDKALECIRQALFISDTNGIRHTQIQALDTMATIHLDEGETNKAQLYIEQALDIAQQYDHSSLIFIYTTMGRLFRMKGELTASVNWGEKAVSLARRYGAGFDIGWSSHELGKTYTDDGRYKEAEQSFTNAFQAYTLFSLYQCMVGMSQLHLLEKQGEHRDQQTKRAELKELAQANEFFWLLPALEKKESSDQSDVQQNSLVIQTLGSFTVSCNGQPVMIKRNSSVRMLQFFITNRDRYVEKDIIMEALFPEGEIDALQNQFHVSLSVLRKALEPQLSSGTQSRFIKRSGNHYIFDTAEIELDVNRFLECIMALDESLSADAAEKNKRAIELYTGDYFEEYPYEPFLDAERVKLIQLFIKATRQLGQYYYEQQKYSNCFDCFEMIIQKDLFQEESLFEYLKMLLEQGFDARAATIARQMIQQYKEEIGVNLENSITQLFHHYEKTISL